MHSAQVAPSSSSESHTRMAVCAQTKRAWCSDIQSRPHICVELFLSARKRMLRTSDGSAVQNKHRK